MSYVYQVYLDKIFDDYEAQSKIGTFVKISDCTHIYKDKSADFYDDETGKLICSIRKKIIPVEHCDNAYNCLYKAARKTKTNSRGVASGKLDFGKLSSNIVKIVDPDKFKSRVMYKNGNVSNYRVSNNVNSMICGYYNYPFGKGKKEASFNSSNVELWENFKPTIEYLEQLFKHLWNPQWYSQNQEIGSSPYRIENTVFSTVTVNLNFRTAIHLDNGDLNDGYSIFFVCKRGNWDGGFLCYPQYGLAIYVEEGDFVIMNPHEYHGNSEFTVNGKTITDDEMFKMNNSRLSFVLYFRQGLLY